MIAGVRIIDSTAASMRASCFSKIKKPDRHYLGNQSVIAGVCIIDTTVASMRAVFH